MIITVDANEARTGIVELLTATWEHVRVGSLKTGDFLIGAHVGIERKTTPDFVASLRDGRLFSQAGRLLRERSRALLMLEGDPLFVDAQLERGALRGVLLTLMVGFRLPILHTRDLEDSASTIRHLAAQEAKRSTRRGASPPRRAQPGGGNGQGCALGNPLNRSALDLLAALPGVGPVRARALATHIGGLAAIARLSVRELLAIPGIGPDTALRIHETLNASRNSSPAPDVSQTPATSKVDRRSPGTDPPRSPPLAHPPSAAAGPLQTDSSRSEHAV